MFHDAPYFAILAFADGKQDPDITALLTLQPRVNGAVIDFADCNPAPQLIEFRLVDVTESPHAIAPRPAGGRQLQMPGQFAVIGEKKKALGIEIEPPHRDETWQPLGQGLENRPSSLRILVGRHKPLRLMIPPEPRRLRRC